MATTEELLTEVLGVLKQHTPLLGAILEQGKETNGRVLKLESAEDRRSAAAQAEADFIAKGWRRPGDDSPPSRVSKTAVGSSASIGVILAGIALGVSKALGL